MIPISELDLINIGVIIKPHGYDGKLIVKLIVDFYLLKFKELFFLETDGLKVPFFFAEKPAKYKDSGLIIKFENISSDGEVNKLIGTQVFTLKENLNIEKEEQIGEFFDFEVYNEQKYIGKVVSFINIPSNPVLSVSSENKNEILIPFVDDFILSIDKTCKKIVFTLPDGLIEIND